jgi:hypothetical protein
VLTSTLHHDSFVAPVKQCNGEENQYKVQPNKSNNDLLRIPLHSILITIALLLPVLNQTLSRINWWCGNCCGLIVVFALG